MNRRHHMRPDGRSMRSTARPGVVMMLATARMLAAAPPRRPRAAAPTPPRTKPAATPKSSSANAAFAAAFADLLKPRNDDWASVFQSLTTRRP